MFTLDFRAVVKVNNNVAQWNNLETTIINFTDNYNLKAAITLLLQSTKFDEFCGS